MSCENIPSISDLEKTKLHVDDLGRLMGTGTGTSTNEVTGQVRPTFNKIINDINTEFDAQIINMGFTRIGTFSSGATLTNPRQTLLWDIADGGDGQEYGWSGLFPKVVPSLSDPDSTGGVAIGAWISRFDSELRIQIREALRRTYSDAGYFMADGSFESGGTLASILDVILHESSGKAYSGSGPFPQFVEPGSAPDITFKEVTPTDGVRDFSNLDIVHDGTDKTDEIVAFLSALPTTHREVFTSGPNIAYNAVAVIAAMPIGCVIICNNSKIGNNTGSYYQKTYGILSRDSTENDTAYVIESGHHPAQLLINDRTAGTPSGNEGRASSIWALGRTSGGGQRTVGIQQWRKAAHNVWAWTIRKLAPWAAVDNKDRMYEQWASGLTIQVGDYTRSSAGFYVADSAGVTGSTPPTHTSGSVSDGGVFWTRYSGYDTTIVSIDELGRFGLNSQPSAGSHINFQQAVDDTSPSYVQALRATGPSKDVLIRLFPTNSASAPVSVPTPRALGDSGTLQIEGITTTYPLVRFYDKFMETFAIGKKSRVITSGATPSVANNNSFVLNYSSPTNVTDFIDGVTDGEISLIFSNANVTLKQGTPLRLSGSIDVTPTPLSVITLRKVSSGGLTSAWIEVSRSIK